MRALGDLRPGQCGYVLSVNNNDARIKRRLIDMGITPGVRITVRKIAPLGDPIEITLRGYELSIRRDDAMSIAIMNPEEENELLKRMFENERDREAKGREAFGAPPHESDEKAHERAASLTEFVMGGITNLRFTDDFQAKPVRIALAGNPNCGKTTLFNAVTGANEYVGNWPGVTVERKEARIREFGGFNTHGHEMTIVDLPGIYSLSPYSMEEVVARNFIIDEQPDAIINIVDGTNLERNLYLTVQLLELERPMIIALNMMDEVAKKGDRIDVRKLSLELGIPVVPISARTGQGVKDLIRQAQKLIKIAHAELHEGFCIEPDDLYDDFTHMIHHNLGDLIKDYAEAARLPLHWSAIKLLEGDKLVRESLKLPASVSDEAERIIRQYSSSTELGDNETMIAESRYKYITCITKHCVFKKRIPRRTVSDKIDLVLTDKYLAIPIFLAIMGLMFALTFGTAGAWLSDRIGMLIDVFLSPAAAGALAAVKAPLWFTSLIVDGIIAGVGGVLTFLPMIALLFFCLSFLEDSGYMARIAFIMDRTMRNFGLSGKSFIPLLMGFGCTVPATMGTRTMENEKDRRMTIMLLPFMSCSAKLPVYGLIAGAFFYKGQGFVVMSLYILGIHIAVGSGLMFKNTLFKGASAPFVMELPPYRMPTLSNTLSHVWERVKHFLAKAGTLILAMSVVLWMLLNFEPSLKMATSAEKSILGLIGSAISPAFAPLGFGTWHAVVALLSGFIAKEAVVSSLSLFYGFSAAAGADAVRASLSGTFTPLSAYSFLVFVLLYTPCMAAVATMRREFGSRKWTALVVVFQIAVAYVASMFVFQVGSMFSNLGLGAAMESFFRY